MLKLKTILHYDILYYLLIGITLVYSIFYLSLPRSSKLNINNASIEGIITNLDISGDLLKLEISGLEKVIGNYYFKTENEKNDFSDKYQLGDKILLTGNFKKPNNNTVFNLFNYKKYLERKRIYYLIDIETITKVKNNNNIFYNLRNIIEKHLDNFESKAYLYAFILGNTDYIDSDILTTYQENGISHLLSISGMHVTLLSTIILGLLKKLKIGIIKSNIITSLFLLFYMILAGSTAPIIRSVLLFIFLSINKLFKLEIKTINVFLLVFCLIVISNPYLIFEVGFQFSFLVSFYLILFQNNLRGNNYIINLFKVSFISFLVSLPISIYYFYQVNLLSIIFNLVFVPLVSFIIFPLSLATFIFPFLDNILMILVEIMEWLSITCSKVEFSKIIFGKPNLYWIFFYYVIVTICLYKKNRIIYLTLIVLIMIQYFSNFIFPKSFLVTIDVGQGDSLLFYTNNKTILVDTGGKISYSKEKWQIRDTKSLTMNTLIPLLKSTNIKKIDYLIITHGDYDHMGEAINLVENFKVDKVIFNNGEYNDLELELIKVLEKKQIPYYQNIKELNIGDNKLYFLNNKIYDNENDNSIVLYTSINNHKLLLMGDAGVEVEEDLIDKYNLSNIDVLKVGHHGSKTSSSQGFIDYIDPNYSIISVGKNNRYGHPNDEVLDILDDSNVYRTDKDGSIMIKFNKNKLEVNTCPP